MVNERALSEYWGRAGWAPEWLGQGHGRAWCTQAWPLWHCCGWPPSTSPGLASASASLCVSCPQTERDVSVRQRAVDLLYAMCDRSNAQQIVAEMLSYLETADYSIREEIVSSGGLCVALARRL